MKMFYKIRRKFKMIITGDLSRLIYHQNEVRFERIYNILKNVDEIGFLEFTDNDVVRNPLVSKIVKDYEKFEKDKGVGKEYV